MVGRGLRTEKEKKGSKGLQAASSQMLFVCSFVSIAVAAD
jgi:hypothetical protein